MPSELSFKIKLGTSPTWKTVAIQRIYDIKRIGGDDATNVSVTFHYIDTELNSNAESDIVIWDRHVAVDKTEEHGKANSNAVNNWVGISNRRITYFDPTWDTHLWTLSKSETADFTWQGTPSSDWNDLNNWSGGIIPGSTSDVVIPDAATTLHSPVLPASTVIKTMTINSGGILEGGNATILTINGSTGSWLNNGTLNPGTSTIIFTNANATMADPTNFYNVTVATGAGLTLESGNVMRIAGALTLNGTGILRAALLPNTIEFNGTNQTVINPNGLTPGYYNLILSGGGTKSLPTTDLTIAGDLTISGSTSALVQSSINLAGELTIGEGATFNTGTFNHSIGGNFDNSGTFTAASETAINLNGTTAQSIYGSATTNFEKLNIDNNHGVTLFSNTNVNNTLSLTSGNLNLGTTTLGINGSINKILGSIETTYNSSLSFGGTSASIIPDNLFSATPSINNLTINRSGGLTLGNQAMVVNGLLDLVSGTLNLGANSLTLAGGSPTRSSGDINASNAVANMTFANSSAIILPASIFSDALNNLTITGTGGVTSSSDITVNSVLNLAATNPSDTKGLLDMCDGATVKTLLMGGNATTSGAGDVTGIVKRNSFVANTEYSFGNQFTSLIIASGGSLPSEMSFKIKIGVAPSWKSSAVQRTYDIVRTGGSGTTVTLSLHYLDSEFQDNIENNIVVWDYHPTQIPIKIEEHGKANQSATENWVAISNRNITYFGTAFDEHPWGISNKESANFVWQGSSSSDWNDLDNWSGGVVPNNLSDVIIPDASTIANNPLLPSSPSALAKTITILGGGILNGGSGTTLTVAGGTGAWLNLGTFIPETSTVVFTNPNATMADPTNFYNVTIENGASLTLGNDNVMRISGALTISGTGILYAASLPNTIEFNGNDQSVTNPNGSRSGYYNLILSGSGTKTMPLTPMTVVGDFTISGTTRAIASNNLTINGNFSSSLGSTLDMSAYSFNLSGNVSGTGTLNTQNTGLIPLTLNKTWTGTVIFNGGSPQTLVNGTFNNLTINNGSGVSLNGTDVIVNGMLTLTNGLVTTGANTLRIGPTGTIVGGSSSSYLNGKLAEVFSTAGGSKIFTVGKDGNYRPLIVDYTKAPDNLSTVTVEQFETTPPGTLPANMTIFRNRYWNISQSGATSLAFKITLDGTGYTPVNQNYAVILNGDGISAYNSATATYSSAGYTNISDLTSFGYFGLAESQNYWTGATSTDWFTGSNWTAGTVPDGNGPVAIPASLVNYPIIMGSNVTMYGGGSIAIGDGASITLPSGPAFTLQQGSLVTTTGTGKILLHADADYLNLSGSTPKLEEIGRAHV